MGPHYMDFTFSFDTTLNRLEMTDIWPKYVAQAFLPPPPTESSAQDPLLEMVKPGEPSQVKTVKEASQNISKH